jgi:thioredoxin 1
MKKMQLAIFLLAMGCSSAVRHPERGSSVSARQAEIQLEKSLNELDLLEGEIVPFFDIKNAIDNCVNENLDVRTKKLEFDLGVARGANKKLIRDKDVEAEYYNLLQEGAPEKIAPVIQLRGHYQEALLDCLLGSASNKHHRTHGGSDISILTESNFETETMNGLVVVDFVTHWCIPCKRMALSLEMLARDYKGTLKIGTLNADRNMAIAEGFDVMNFPTLVLLRNGREVKRLRGFYTYIDLKKWIQSVISESHTNSISE